jgi:hypothetical protein
MSADRSYNYRINKAIHKVENSYSKAASSLILIVRVLRANLVAGCFTSTKHDIWMFFYYRFGHFPSNKVLRGIVRFIPSHCPTISQKIELYHKQKEESSKHQQQLKVPIKSSSHRFSFSEGTKSGAVVVKKDIIGTAQRHSLLLIPVQKETERSDFLIKT